MGWNPKKTYEEAKSDPLGAAREGVTTYSTGGLNQVDRELGGKGAKAVSDLGKGISDMNPFRQPDLKDIPDPTAPANVREPTMAPGSGPAQVKNPLDPKNVKIGTVKDPKAALIDMSQQGQFRDYQAGLASQLAGQAQGIGPSLAVNTLRQGQEANLAATMAQLNSQRGGGNPAMARATMQTASEIQGKAAMEAADARLKEQMQAQSLLGQVAGQGRQGDIQLATEQAQMQQQAAMEKYKGDLQLAVEQGRIDQQTAMTMFEQANQNARQDANLKAQFAELQAKYAGMGMDAQKANQMAALEIQRMKSAALQAQNAQSMAAANANKAMFGQILGAAGTVAGAVYGGPAGAAAGGAVGTAAGGAMSSGMEPGYDDGGNSDYVEPAYTGGPV